MIEDLKMILVKKSQDYNISFKAVGISKDWSVNKGVEHLNKFGEFDEIITGNNWLNLGLMKFVWQDFPGDPATPQLILVKRKISNHGGGGVNLYLVDQEKIILRKLGTVEIDNWHEQNEPFPDF
tara:strand:- start:573 stop:944 length:372 start_codon:yes stop_codon:yes gene_type:complete